MWAEPKRYLWIEWVGCLEGSHSSWDTKDEKCARQEVAVLSSVSFSCRQVHGE